MLKLIVLVFILIASGYFLYSTNLLNLQTSLSPAKTTPQNQSNTSNTTNAQFVNNTYKYSLNLPDQFTLNSFQDNNWTIAYKNDPNFKKLVYILPLNFAKKQPLKDYLTEISHFDSCNADSTDLSSFCDKVLETKAITTPNKLAGFEVYLNQVLTNHKDGKVENKRFGPFIFLDTEAATNSYYQALEFELPIESTIQNSDVEAIKMIVDSLKISN